MEVTNASPNFLKLKKLIRTLKKNFKQTVFYFAYLKIGKYFILYKITLSKFNIKLLNCITS